jgi:hypothetical protein
VAAQWADDGTPRQWNHMSDSFRFSPRSNRAREIQWRPWSSDVFDEAAVADRPILLSIAVL